MSGSDEDGDGGYGGSVGDDVASPSSFYFVVNHSHFLMCRFYMQYQASATLQRCVQSVERSDWTR
jgi:hypothetical protein